MHTGSTAWLEQYLPDMVEFVADVHTLGKVSCAWCTKYFLETTNIFPLQVKSHVRGMTVGLNQDTLGGILKVCITRYLYSIYNTIYTLSTIL